MKKLTYYSFEVVIEKEDEGKVYYAYCPNLSGVYSNGKTIEEARTNIREALELHLESLSAHRRKVLLPQKLVHVEEICIGLPA